jgi:hypothetical protein
MIERHGGVEFLLGCGGAFHLECHRAEAGNAMMGRRLGIGWQPKAEGTDGGE